MFLVPMSALQAASDDKVPGSFPVRGRNRGQGHFANSRSLLHLSQDISSTAPWDHLLQHEFIWNIWERGAIDKGTSSFPLRLK